MSDNFIGEAEPMEALGYQRRADLIKALDAMDVFYLIGRAGKIAVPKTALPLRQNEEGTTGPIGFQFD